MIRPSHLICITALLAACAPPAPATVSAEAPTPSERHVEAFPDCEWGEVRAAGMSIWSYACANDRLVGDEALPGFQREVRDASGQVTRAPAIRFFAKPAEAPIEAVLAAVRAASPGAEACIIEPGSHGDYVLMPTGEAFEAHQRFIRGEADGPSMPCGPLGPLEAGGHTFRLVESAPDKVVMIDWGTSVPIFDPDTLRVSGE
jgi:hypothetical protein